MCLKYDWQHKSQSWAGFLCCGNESQQIMLHLEPENKHVRVMFIVKNKNRSKSSVALVCSSKVIQKKLKGSIIFKLGLEIRIRKSAQLLGPRIRIRN